MALGQIEFTVVLAVFSGFLIFTPERLVLLRSLCVWAVCILVAWHGYGWWKRNPWIENIATAFTEGHVLSDIAGLLWAGPIGTLAGWANRGVGLVRQEIIAVGSAALGWGQALLRWARGLHRSAAGSPSPATLPRHQTYVAILVTTPPIHNYGPVSDLLYTTVDHPEPIPWSATDTTTHCIPPMLASLAFRRHFALCLVPETVWESKTMALREKLTGARFWDHGGSTPSSNAAAWPPDRIGKINAIQVLGSVGADEDATARCTAIYNTLIATWGEYRNIWWNDGDLALALAYLLVPTAALMCRALLRRLGELRKTEVTDTRRNAWGKGFTAGRALFAGACVLTAVTGGAALPLTEPVMAASLSAGFASTVTAASLQEAEAMRWRDRRAACGRLETEFPRLRELFA